MIQRLQRLHVRTPRREVGWMRSRVLTAGSRLLQGSMRAVKSAGVNAGERREPALTEGERRREARFT
jgi:hypothetical protein